jgi:large subunit ribosomal protein L2
MRVGRKVSVGEEVPIENGNRLALKDIPTGTIIHAIELQPGKGAQLARTAGSGAQLVAKEDQYAQVRLPSGEVRLISVDAMASIGSVGNEQHQNIQWGKAGRKRHMGIRPTVRGVVMAAADHPHGGGDGGRHRMARPPTTPWGQKTLGYKTRRRKTTTKFIVKSRHASKRR